MKSLDIHKSEYLKQFETQTYGRNLFRTQEEERLDAPNEECGIFGMYSDNDLDTFSLSQFGLFALQHRGQEACGISVLKDGKIYLRKPRTAQNVPACIAENSVAGI